MNAITVRIAAPFPCSVAQRWPAPFPAATLAFRRFAGREPDPRRLRSEGVPVAQGAVTDEILVFGDMVHEKVQDSIQAAKKSVLNSTAAIGAA